MVLIYAVQYSYRSISVFCKASLIACLRLCVLCYKGGGAHLLDGSGTPTSTHVCIPVRGISIRAFISLAVPCSTTVSSR